MVSNRKKGLSVGIGLIVLGIAGIVAFAFLNSGCASAAKQSPGGGALVKDASYTVVVDYQTTVYELRQQTGYGKIIVDDNPSPVVERKVACRPGRSPDLGTQTVRLQLVRVTGDSISLGEAAVGLSEYTDWGDLATTEELLAFSQQYPEVQKYIKVVAAGTGCYLLGINDDYDYRPYIYHRHTSALGEPERIFGMMPIANPVDTDTYLLIRER